MGAEEAGGWRWSVGGGVCACGAGDQGCRRGFWALGRGAASGAF